MSDGFGFAQVDAVARVDDQVDAVEGDGFIFQHGVGIDPHGAAGCVACSQGGLGQDGYGGEQQRQGDQDDGDFFDVRHFLHLSL